MQFKVAAVTFMNCTLSSTKREEVEKSSKTRSHPKTFTIAWKEEDYSDMSLQELPTEIIQKISARLNWAQALSLSQTCRTINQLMGVGIVLSLLSSL